MQTIEVPTESIGLRLDAFIAQAWPALSRRAAQAAIANGEVRVNGRRARKGMTLAPGDRVDLGDDVGAPPRLAPNTALEIAVVHEDSALVALDKPAGIASLALSADETRTVANFLIAHFPETSAASQRPLEPGIVHRLDTNTSGIIVAARTAAAYDRLRLAFHEHRVEKEYIAIVDGRVDSSGEIRAPLRGDPRDRRRVEVCEPQAKGALRAATEYRSILAKREYSVLVVRIRTGVRHQIRAHLASIGHPIVGDRLYGGSLPRGTRRHLLHACLLAFEHPNRSGRIELRCAPPPEFKRWLAGDGARQPPRGRATRRR